MSIAESSAPARSVHRGRRMSLAEYEALPEEKPYLEYWDGVVLQKGVPSLTHGRFEKMLMARFTSFEAATGAEAIPEPRCWFEGHGYLIPDIGLWMPGKAQGSDTRALPPTLAIEVRSPDQSLAELREKCRTMRRHAVDVCWLIDPYARRAEAFEGDHDATPYDETGILSSAFLPGFELALAELFAAA
jgi:Uma2 family endonuclease